MKSLKLHNIHFIETLKNFERRKQDEGKSQSHITSVTSHSREFLHYLESISITNLKSLKQGDISDYFTYLENRKNQRKQGALSNAYLEKHREAVLRLMEYVLNTDIGKSGFYIQSPKKQIIPKEILTREEVAKLFNQTQNTMDGLRTRAILSALYGLGLRKGELHKLNTEDINMAKDTVRIRKTKTASQRDVPMSPKVKQNIEDYLYNSRQYLEKEGSQESAFLLNNYGERMSLSGIAYKIKALSKSSNIQKPITAHRLRHAIGTHLLGNFTIEEIALFLGHRSIDSSQIYTHIKYNEHQS